jgi:hypothetical protein
MSIPYRAHPEDEQPLGWTDGSVRTVLLDAQATDGQLGVGRVDVGIGEAPPFHPHRRG